MGQGSSGRSPNGMEFHSHVKFTDVSLKSNTLAYGCAIIFSLRFSLCSIESYMIIKSYQLLPRDIGTRHQ